MAHTPLPPDQEIPQHPYGPDEPVWTFRGYEMRPGEFNTSMVHFYRAEVQRANTWRTRLDATTNWAIVCASAAISFSLSDPTRHHGVILLTLLLIYIFLFIEARRYRYFELWSQRIRLLETDFFAAMLTPPFKPSVGWAEKLAGSLRNPRFPISMWEAIGRRLRRNYLAIILVMILVWLFKNYTQPTAVTTWADFVDRAAIGTFPGVYGLGLVALIALGSIALALATVGLQDSPGEVLYHRTCGHGSGRKPSSGAAGGGR